MRTELLVSLFLFAAALPAQAASSPNFFLPSIELAPGSSSGSTNYRMTVALGSGVVPVASASANFKIPGGFAATLDVGFANQPWLTAVTPRFVTPKSQVTLNLLGTGLGSSTNPTVQVGSLNAPPTNVTNHRIVTKLPFQAGPPSKPAPGWNTVRVTNSGGTTTLTKAIGVLPMLYTDPAPAPNTKFDLVFKGTQGDTILWVIGIPPITPIPLGANLYGLAINPIVTMPALGIPNANGEFRLPIQPTNYQGPFYAQALFVSNNPGYAPGSFSNVFEFK